MFGGSDTVPIGAGTLSCRGSEVAVELARRDGTVERVALPYPVTGLGGMELIVSPDERYAALFVYSGQAEQGWELFAIDAEAQPALRHVSRLPYVHGEGLAPVFSPDSRMLAMVVTSVPCERGTGEDAEALLDPEARGEVLIDWAVLYAQRIPDGQIEASPIGTWVRRSMNPDELLGWDLYESIRFVSPNRLVLPLPWGGTLDLLLPLGGPVTTPNATPTHS